MNTGENSRIYMNKLDIEALKSQLAYAMDAVQELEEAMQAVELSEKELLAIQMYYDYWSKHRADPVLIKLAKQTLTLNNYGGIK